MSLRTAARFSIVLACAFSSTVMTSADVRPRAAVAPFPIALTQYVCYDPDCWFNAWVVTAPGMATAGPADTTPTWSPDGTHIAFTRSNDIMVVDAATGAVVNITNHVSVDSSSAWSPNGQRIAFLSDRDGHTELYVMDPDGSDVTQVTNNDVITGRPTWSPDSTRLAFGCIVEAFNSDICAVDVDGTSFQRLTNDLSIDSDPAWSPDGTRIVFATTRYGDQYLAFMQPDGTFLSLAGQWIAGSQPAWSSDGNQIAYKAYTGIGFFGFDVFTMGSDGSDVTLRVFDAEEPAWKPGGLFASFRVDCNGLTCTVDATRSVGTISAYAWDFGDQTSATGSVVTHTFPGGGQFVITLTVAGATGGSSTTQEWVQLNVPPVASFTVSCTETFMCVFDPSASYDPEGGITQVNWAFGDGSNFGCLSYTCSVLAPREHLYSAAGTYTATLRLTDAGGVTAETSRTFTLVATPAHIADLDASVSAGQGPWTATVTIQVHAASHNPYQGAMVTAVWDNGVSVYCVTDAVGRCTVRQTRIPPARAVRLTITGVTYTVGGYAPAANHDPDGDSDGTTIIVSKR